MDAIEAKVRCLELAAAIHRKQGDGSPAAEAVVQTATVLYSYVQAPPVTSATTSQGTDKPQPGKPGTARKPQPDILS